MVLVNNLARSHAEAVEQDLLVAYPAISSCGKPNLQSNISQILLGYQDLSLYMSDYDT